MKNSLKIYFLIFIFLIFSTYSTNQSGFNYSVFFPIKNVLIANSVFTSLSVLKSDLSFLNNTSLVFLNKEKILKTINKHRFISNIKLKKKYPNTLKIEIIERIPVAIQIINKKKFYITKDNERIKFIDLKLLENWVPPTFVLTTLFISF